jgi:hypothetical protein
MNALREQSAKFRNVNPVGIVHRVTDKCDALASRPIHCGGGNRTEHLGCWSRFRLQGQGLFFGGGGIYTPLVMFGGDT